MGCTFRPLTDDDLPLLHGWLNEPGVVAWWEGDDVSWDNVVREYGTANPDPTEHWLALDDGEPVGWVQLWATIDELPYTQPWWDLGVNRSSGGIDYLVGPPERRGGGFGSSMLRAFVEQVGFGLHPHYTQIGAAPVPANEASWRALRKAGFEPVGIVAGEHDEEFLHVATRPGVPVMRPERDGDHDAIAAVVAAAFGSTVEADLVAALRTDDSYEPDLALVAEHEGEVAGHVMVTWAHVGEHRVLGLSPLAVRPDLHGRGIGGALVREVAARCHRHGAPCLVLQGAPAYYSRFGFVPSEPLGITMDLPAWASPEAAQVFLLKGYDPAVRGHVELPAPFAGLPAEG